MNASRLTPPVPPSTAHSAGRSIHALLPLPDRQDPLIALQGIQLRFGARQVLRDIDLRIYPREIVSLIGPNGAGKSTLIKVLLGLQTGDAGKRTLQPGLRCAYVPQQFELSPALPLRVRDLLALEKAPVALHQQVVAEIRLESLLEHQVSTLSGGERQRVLLARALLRQPQLLVLDEPMQGLDAHSEAELYHYVRELPWRHGCAVVMVSHDLHWVMQGTHRVVCLNQHICCSGTPAQVAQHAAFQDLFGGHRLWYQHHHDHCQHDGD